MLAVFAGDNGAHHAPYPSFRYSTVYYAPYNRESLNDAAVRLSCLSVCLFHYPMPHLNRGGFQGYRTLKRRPMHGRCHTATISGQIEPVELPSKGYLSFCHAVLG